VESAIQAKVEEKAYFQLPKWFGEIKFFLAAFQRANFRQTLNNQVSDALMAFAQRYSRLGKNPRDA
jgi:hypothetical protein